MFIKKRRLAVLLAALIIPAFIVLTVPIVPVQHTVTQTITSPLRYSSQGYYQFNTPRFVNVTNVDSVGGVFSVKLELVDYKPVVGGIEGEVEETVTQSLFINAGATETFNSPQEWITLESIYSFYYSVTAPPTQEKYNVTTTEYKSIISIICNL